jgi:hypothetical protein
MFEPRISGNVLPFGDDNAKLSLGWGIYNAPLNLSVIKQALDQQQIDIFFDHTGTVLGGSAISQLSPSAPRECHLDTARKWCNITYRDSNSPTPLPQ